MRSTWSRRVVFLLQVLAVCALAFGQDINIDRQIYGSREPYSAIDSGAANAYVLATTKPLAPTLRTLSRFYFFAANANTGASTANVDGTGVLAIKKWSSGSLVALASGDISANQLVELFYDGTEYQCVTCISASSGAVGVKVNGSAISGTNANFSDSTPAAGTNYANVKWQKDTTTPDTNVSAEMPAALDTALGLIKSATCSAHNWISSITSGTGAIGCSQPSFGDISGTAGIAQGGTNTTNSPIKRFDIRAAVCSAGVGYVALDNRSGNAGSPTCTADNQNSGITWPDADAYYFSWPIPADWSSFNKITFWFTSTDTTNGHTIIWSFATYCVQPNNNIAEPNGPTYNTASTVTTTIGASAVSAGKYSASISSFTTTGCSTGYEMRMKFTRNTDTATNAVLNKIEVAYNGSYQ